MSEVNNQQGEYQMTTFRAELATARLYERLGLYRNRRPAVLRALGTVLHPEAITAAWYAADCPPLPNYRALGLSLSTRMQWRLACALRGAQCCDERRQAGGVVSVCECCERPDPKHVGVLTDDGEVLDFCAECFDALTTAQGDEW